MGVNLKLNLDLRPQPFIAAAGGPFIRHTCGALHCGAPHHIFIPFPPLVAERTD